MQTLTFVIRDAVVGDGAGIGRVHVDAWRAAYGSVLTADYLASLSSADRGTMWENALASPPGRDIHRLVAVDQDERVVGFAVVGPMRSGDEDASQDGRLGQLHVINVSPTVWGAGVGQQLHDVGVSRLGSAFTEAVLWVHPDNGRARRFYERNGWIVENVTRSEEILGVAFDEVRYRTTLGDRVDA